MTAFILRNMPRHSVSRTTIEADGQTNTGRRDVDGDPRSRRAKCVCATCRRIAAKKPSRAAFSSTHAGFIFATPYSFSMIAPSFVMDARAAAIRKCL